MLQHKIFSELYTEWEGKVDMALFREAYPRSRLKFLRIAIMIFAYLQVS